eukprot:scaffold406_cov391-Prasinococcus_capsulatus_cf.AAC.13
MSRRPLTWHASNGSDRLVVEAGQLASPCGRTASMPGSLSAHGMIVWRRQAEHDGVTYMWGWGAQLKRLLWLGWGLRTVIRVV